jgi:kumamolisin
MFEASRRQESAPVDCRFKTFMSALKAASAAALLLAPLTPASAQMTAHRTRAVVVIPRSSQTSPSDIGLRSHTNLRFIVPNGVSPDEAPPFAGYAYETPASLACLYQLARPVRGCNPNQTTVNSSGGSRSIAIVDAYDDPNAAADLAYFSTQFGLPPANFTVVYAQGSAPPVDSSGGWELEESLDIEYAHAMAPKAKIYLVEANSNYDSDLYPAIQVASNLVACGSTHQCPRNSSGKGEVSLSWGGGEFQEETSLDAYFTTPNVVYFAAAGDESGVIYPCASPNVVCAGGTSIARSEYNGDYISEIAWSDAGGGVSYYEPIPRYQATDHAVAAQLGGYRGLPDVSADSNPNTGAWVWDTYPYETSEGYETGWYIVGGTSLATPLLAGVFNATGNFGPSSFAELTDIYTSRNRSSFHDITYGACGYYSGSFSNSGWDLCTGMGSPGSLDLK